MKEMTLNEKFVYRLSHELSYRQKKIYQVKLWTMYVMGVMIGVASMKLLYSLFGRL